MTTCCIKDCDRPVFSRGMCSTHYARVRKYGDPTRVQVSQLHCATLMERFLHYTEKGNGCWLWLGSKDANGYGRLNIANRPVLAHRLAWQLFCHEITSEQHVLHRCDNPPCVRPDHLFLGNQAANNADMLAKGRYRPGVSRGSNHGCAKLTEKQVRQIRASTGTAQQIADQFGVSRRQVRDIRARRSWRHLE